MKRFFLDRSSKSIKAMLLRDGNKDSSLLGFWFEYGREVIKYFKMVIFLMILQDGFAKLQAIVVFGATGTPVHLVKHATGCRKLADRSNNW